MRGQRDDDDEYGELEEVKIGLMKTKKDYSIRNSSAVLRQSFEAHHPFLISHHHLELCC